jgi:hypothetical protein
MVSPAFRFLPAFLASTALAAAWTLFAGKDVNWDLLNYHYYAPFQLLTGRLEQDFFAASAQGYLNPLGYLPFYLMVAGGWHAVVASLVLAALHATSVGLLYVIAGRLFAHLAGRERIVMAALAAALGAATSVFWMMIGGSFLDPLLAPLMLGGLALLLDPAQGSARRAFGAGALFGAASALKYSNAFFALAALPLAFTGADPKGGGRLRAGLAYVAGGAVALAVLAGPWFLVLWREFGNPVFPLMNAWFESPYAPAGNVMSERFKVGGLAAALAFPLRVATLDPLLYIETLAPDIRFAALLVALLALAAAAALGRAPVRSGLTAVDWRLFAFFATAAALWLASSANGRYGLVVLFLAGVCLARVTERLLPPRATRITLAVLLAVQIAMAALASPTRWTWIEPWSSEWLPYRVAQKGRAEPALYLTVEELPVAVLAPFLHPESSFVNFRGQFSVPTDSPKLAALLERHRGRVRTIGRNLQGLGPDGQPLPRMLRFYDSVLARIGYRLDLDDCFSVQWSPQTEDWLSRAANALAPPRASDPRLFSVASCALVPAPRSAEMIAAERRVSQLFDRMEKSCPRLFRGQTAVTDTLGIGWSRVYPGLDARLETDGERVVLYHIIEQRESYLGRLADWDGASVAGACHGQQ